MSWWLYGMLLYRVVGVVWAVLGNQAKWSVPWGSFEMNVSDVLVQYPSLFYVSDNGLGKDSAWIKSRGGKRRKVSISKSFKVEVSGREWTNNIATLNSVATLFVATLKRHVIIEKFMYIHTESKMMPFYLKNLYSFLSVLVICMANAK